MKATIKGGEFLIKETSYHDVFIPEEFDEEQQMIAQGADPAGGTPAQFGQFVQREHDKWRLIVRDSGARAE